MDMKAGNKMDLYEEFKALPFASLNQHEANMLADFVSMQKPLIYTHILKEEVAIHLHAENYIKANKIMDFMTKYKKACEDTYKQLAPNPGPKG